MEFQRELEEARQLAEARLRVFFPGGGLEEAMRYSLLAGGKRVRPILALKFCEALCGEMEPALDYACGIEMLHTYSLIHDDLPALDNDDYRRGRKASHVVFGEAMGILSGDALLNYAYEAALHGFDLTENTSRVVLAMQILAAKSGLYGMLGGQSVDVDCGGKVLDGDALISIYLNKTSALIEAAFMIGAVLAGAGDEQIRAMEQAGQKIGLAFQIQDDILDVSGNLSELGKPVHSDEKNQKSTYVTLYGMEEAAGQVKRLSGEAVEILEGMAGEKEFLLCLVRQLVTRNK